MVPDISWSSERSTLLVHKEVFTVQNSFLFGQSAENFEIFLRDLPSKDLYVLLDPSGLLDFGSTLVPLWIAHLTRI